METAIGVISFIGGFIIKDFFKFQMLKRKKDYQYEIEIMKKANKSMEKLLTKMSTSKNSINEYLKDDSNITKLKKANKDISECVNYFEKNRADLFLYIAKEESPIFIDHTIVLRDSLLYLKEKKDNDILNDLSLSLSNYQKLYDNYYQQYELFSKRPKI
jgi:transcriptional regulator with XRE-family HTH domain